MKNTNLTKPTRIKQKLFLIFHGDGIMDIVSGITILLLSAVMAFDSAAFIGMIGIPIIFYIPLKERISIPRIGLIRFESETETRKKLSLILLLGVFVLFGFMLFSLLGGSWSGGILAFLRNHEIILFGFLLGITLLAAARIMNNTRFYLYTLLAILLVLAARFTSFKVWTAVLILAVAMEAFGIYYLIRFLGAYPISSKDE